MDNYSRCDEKPGGSGSLADDSVSLVGGVRGVICEIEIPVTGMELITNKSA